VAKREGPKEGSMMRVDGAPPSVAHTMPVTMMMLRRIPPGI
jgi:hypothetical protein